MGYGPKNAYRQAKEELKFKEDALMAEADYKRMVFNDEKGANLEKSNLSCWESEETVRDYSSSLLLERILFNKAMEELPIGLTISDLEGRIVYTNTAEAAMHGYIPQELIGKDVRIFAPRGLWQPIELQKLESRKDWQRETVNMRKDKSIFPVRLTSTLIKDHSDTPIGFVTLCEDLTSNKNIKDLSKNSGQFKIVGERSSNNSGQWEWDTKSNKINFSAYWKAMLGFEEQEIGDELNEWLDRVHPDDRRLVRLEIINCLEGDASRLECEHRILHKNGSYRWVMVQGEAIKDVSGENCKIIGSQTDITERVAGLHDTLTGLPNRTLFNEQLKRALKRVKKRSNYKFALLLLDLDRFANVNISFSHDCGDSLLIAISQRLEACLRCEDIIARMEGDEFAIFLDAINDKEDALRVCGRIEEILKAPFNMNGQDVFISASSGIVLSRKDYEQPEELLRDAHTAMRRAKSLGKARYELFDPAMHTNAVALLQLDNSMRRAVNRNEFQLYYQPIISTATDKIAGFEALVRWQHPELGLVLPDDFIPMAEETGLIIQIGKIVLQRACSQMRKWQGLFPQVPLFMSVNLSARQFTEPDLIEELDHILEETGLQPDRLKLEITESVIMENPQLAVSIFSRMRAMNISLLLDDFGTGYSSLGYLHDFPVNTLKIDRCFINGIGSENKDSEILRIIVMLANCLGLDVIAEGVETSDQLNRLRSIGCQYYQGYYFSKPIKEESAEDLIARFYHG
jgi:diguanylate cyclase (GGDEF)-like protein/PAS domain S-box-containing protein